MAFGELHKPPIAHRLKLNDAQLIAGEKCSRVFTFIDMLEPDSNSVKLDGLFRTSDRIEFLVESETNFTFDANQKANEAHCHRPLLFKTAFLQFSFFHL